MKLCFLSLQLVQSVGAAILPYADQLVQCLEKCVHLKSKSGSNHASKVVQQIYSVYIIHFKIGDTCKMYWSWTVITVAVASA